MTGSTTTTVVLGGRRKAYRPLPLEDRRAALAAGIAAYAAGDHFLAHELLEPAWMGTDDPIERDVHQGLIKLAAAFVHGARGNPLGIAKNLRGAAERLGSAAAEPAGLRACLGRLGVDLDIASVITAIEDRLLELDERPDDPDVAPVMLSRRSVP